ncbi:hypothetical protein NQ318_010726 [Aromia moschata]|uniref:Uncharacterized protein n=1 Tax=Aromia moschata TaxID=1265417 RepID=A0AAV8YKD2_9CUCU|nr:hypothetical protein NQ318_010726 [Aromia moschata]
MFDTMSCLRIVSVLAAIGVCGAGQVAVYPLPVWPGMNPAGISNTFFDQFDVPVAVPERIPRAGPGNVAANGEQGGGSKQYAQHFDDQGKLNQKAFIVDVNHDIHNQGQYDKFRDSGHLGEKGGADKNVHNEASHHQAHHEKAKSLKAAKFGEKKGHKRGHKTKGYHNKFHKDEYHKEHRFYDDLDKTGHHSKFGKFNTKYGKKAGAHKKGRNHKSGSDEKKFGKEGFSDKGHSEEEHKGHKKSGGHESYHKNFSDYAKDHGVKKGSAHAYAHDKD